MMQNEKWQVEVNGNVYDCEFAELEQWIADRALLPEDHVRRAERGWVKAGRVPVLQKFFAGEKTQNPAAAVTSTASSNLPTLTPAVKSDACHFHQDETASYLCRACGKLFCKACPKSYGTVRICPVCGEMCRPFSEAQAKINQSAARDRARRQGYNLTDFGKAWVYPFKFWQSLALGALFVAFLSLGGFFGFLLANAILFGCIAQAVSFVAQGDFEQNFMPDFDNFNVWDGVARPFLLSLGVLLVSYLPTGLLLFALFFSVLNSLANPLAVIKSQQENSAAAVKESVSTQILLDPKEAEKHLSAGDIANPARSPQPPVEQKDLNALLNGNPEEKAAAVQKIEEMSGKTSGDVPPAAQKTDSQIMYSIFEPIFKSSPLIILLLIISLLWAIFYLPMALTIAGYTRSLAATLNPLVGIGTMRKMGGVYVAAFFFCLIVQGANLLLSGFIGYLTKPFELPLVGNLPGGFLTAMCSFYFSLVIAFLLGSALYKTADKLGIRAT